MKFKTYVLHIKGDSRFSAPFGMQRGAEDRKGAQKGAEDPHENSNTSNFDEIQAIYMYYILSKGDFQIFNPFRGTKVAEDPHENSNTSNFDEI